MRCVLRHPAADGDGDGHRPTRYDAAPGDERLPRARSGRQRLVQPCRRVDVCRLRRNIRDRDVRRPDLLRPGQRLRGRRRGVPRRRRQHERASDLRTQVRRDGAGGQRVARARPRCKRLVLEADHRLLRGQRRDLGDRVMHGPRHLHRAGRRRRERRRQLHGRCRQPHHCGGVDSVRLDGAERRRRPGPAARRERLVFQAALHHLQGQRPGLGRRLVYAPDPLRTPRRRGRQGHGNVSGRGRQRELTGDDVLQVRCDSTDGTDGEDRRRRWQRHTRMGRRDRRGKLRGPARAGREARPRIGAVAWHRPQLRRPLGQERDATIAMSFARATRQGIPPTGAST